MLKYLTIFALISMSFVTDNTPSFKDAQLENSRVLTAFMEKGEEAYAKLKAAGVSHFSYDMYIRAFKFEEVLEVWAKNKEDSTYSLVNTYPFCSNVGSLGPKRKEGDNQIPEGFYNLSKFNPTSSFYLSLKVDYPNACDSVHADKVRPGGMIFIHGGCKTIGCIPITDDGIKELYVLCVEAKEGGQGNIPIHIFPAKLTEENMVLMRKQYTPDLLSFWVQLKRGYDLFEENKRIPRVVMSSRGEYFCFPD